MEPDVARMKSGGFLRGRVIEYVPSSHVLLRGADGTLHRFPWSEVAYAGPDDQRGEDAPRSAAPPAPPSAGSEDTAARPQESAPAAPRDSEPVSKVQVRFDGPVGHTFRKSGPGLEFRVAGAPSSSLSLLTSAELCTAPCTAELSEGTHTFFVVKPNAGSVESNPVFIDEQHRNVSGEFIDKSGRRRTPEDRFDCRMQVRLNAGLLAASGILGLASVSSGVVLMLQRDRVELKALAPAP
jgi:hypothetical protein